MGKKLIEKAKNSKLGKNMSHTGNVGLVPHVNNPNVMVTKKVRKAQGEK